MVLYSCYKCGKEFKQKSGIDRHYARKFPCTKSVVDPTKTFNCQYCFKSFRHSQSKWRHEKKCDKQIVKHLETANTILQNENNRLEKEKAQIMKYMEKLLQVNSEMKTTHITNITNNNTYIQLNNFGSENTKYITEKLLNKLLRSPQTAVPELIQQIHFHPDHPENRNIKITNKRERFAHIFTNSQWQLARKTDVLTKMITSGFTILDNCFENGGKTSLTTRKQKAYKSFQNEMDDDNSSTTQRALEDTELIILNNSKK